MLKLCQRKARWEEETLKLGDKKGWERKIVLGFVSDLPKRKNKDFKESHVMFVQYNVCYKLVYDL